MAHDSGKTIADLIADQVKKTPDYVSVVYDGLEEKSATQRITYSEMWERANQVLEELQRCGAMKTTVGVCIEPDINLPSVLLGILRASSSFFPFGVDGLGFVKQSLEKLGVTYLLLDGGTLESLQFLLMDLQVDIVPSEGLQTLGIYLGKVCGSRAGEGQLKPVPGLAYCITTSGTTGTPKVVRVPHTCIVPNILDFRREFQLKIGDVTFLTSPLTFDPSVIDIFMTLSSGAALLVAPAVVKMSGDSLLSVLTSRHKVTCLQITPSLFRRLDPGRVRSTLLGADSPLRLLAFGGEAFPSRTVLDVCLHPENCTRIYNVYGITEVSCWATIHCARAPKGSVKEPVPIGEALTGTRVKVVDQRGIDVKIGTGQIMIGGSDRVCLLNEEGEQVLSEKGPWRRTGDVGLVHSDGSIYCLGRDDRQIKRHGKRLDLNTLEEVCCRKTTIEECRAVHKKDQLLLFFKTAAHVDAEEDRLCREVRCHLKDVLPSQYQPDEVVLVSSFPVNSHGKLDVASLVQLLKCRTEQHRSLAPACVELWSGKLWQGILGDQRRTVSPADKFLACGGDSLKAVHLVEQVQQHLGQDVPDLLDIILTKTFADFVYFIRQKWRCNGCADEIKLVKDHRNGELYVRRHDPGNRVDLSEPPVKVRKEASQSSCLDRTVLSDQEHFISDTMSDISTPCIQKPNGTITDLAKKQEHTDGKKRTCHKLFDRKSPKHVNKDAHITGTDMFICSISRARTCWLSSDSARTCQDISGKNSGNKFCSPLQEERERSIIELELQWACDTGKCVDASPLVGKTKSGKTLTFIGSHSHRFFAVDISSGTVVWSIQLGDRVESSACLSPCGRHVVVGCYDHQLYVLKADTGEVEWQVGTGDVVKCSPVADLVSHLVFCGSHDGFLYAVSCNKQRVSWKSWMGGGGVFASPVLASDSSAVYTATLRGHVTAASTMTGTVVWRVSLGKPVFSSPAVYDDGLYVGCVDSCLYCLSRVTGLQMWTYRTEAPIFSSPVITTSSIGQKRCILFGCHDNCLYCITDTGELVWKHHTLSTVYASPFVFSLHEAQKNKNGNIHFSQHLEKLEAQDISCCFNGNQLSKKSKESISTEGLEWGCHVQAHTDMQKVDPQAAQKTNLLLEFGIERHAPCQSSLKNGKTEDALCCSQTGGRSDLCIQGYLQKERHNTNEIPGSELFSRVMQPDEDCALGEQFVACASTEGSVRVLSCATGSLIGEKTLPGEVFSSPVVVGRHLIVGCRDDRVYCYKLNLLRQLSA